MRLAVVLSVLLGTASWHAAIGANCTAITETVLTSAGCPSDCSQDGGFACVLFSPLEQCASPLECRHTDDYTLLGADATCSLSYACVQARYGYAEIPVNAVAKVQSLKYPSDMSDVWFQGSTAATYDFQKSDMHRASLDASVFQTPATLTGLHLYNLDLSDQLNGVTLSPSLAAVDFINNNLDAVPPQVEALPALQFLNLRLNNIASLPPYQSLQDLSVLVLSENQFTAFNYSLPSLQSLILSNNPLAEFPSAIFDLPRLVELDLSGCNLTNVHVTAAQHEFLSVGLRSLFADFQVTQCRDGYEKRPIQRRLMFGVEVCVQVAQPARE